jgi:hypothetical protein
MPEHSLSRRSILLAGLASAFVGTGSATAKTRKKNARKPAEPAPSQDTRGDLPMPDPSSMRTGAPKYMQQMGGENASGLSGPNGQMLTRQRNF